MDEQAKKATVKCGHHVDAEAWYLFKAAAAKLQMTTADALTEAVREYGERHVGQIQKAKA